MTIVKTIHFLSLACVVGVLLSATPSEAKRQRAKARMPTWNDIMHAAVETLLEDIPEKIEKSSQQLGRSILGGG